MKKILFDSSVHFGQFSLKNEELRKGCKKTHGLIHAGREAQGIWSDLENGRVDATIWKLNRELQEAYYPFMDKFFETSSIWQPQTTDEEMELALELKKDFSSLHPYSRLACARAIAERVAEMHTLYDELLEPELRAYMLSRSGIHIIRPESKEDTVFFNDDVDNAYWHALRGFRDTELEIVDCLLDSRKITLA